MAGKRSEKYIIVRNSSRKGMEDKISAYVVYIPYKDEDGKTTHYNQTFSVKDYVNPAAAKKAAIKDRDRVLWLLDRENKERRRSGWWLKTDHTVQEIYDLIPDYFARSKATNKKYDKLYGKYIKPLFGDMKVSDIELADAYRTLKEIASTSEQQQVRNLKTIWHRIFQVGIIKRMRVTDWTLVIDTPQSKKISERALSEQNITEEDFQRFCDAMSEYGEYPEDAIDKIYNRQILVYMLRLMRITGIRPQEGRAVARDCIVIRKTTEKADTKDAESIESATVIIKRSAGSTLTETNTLTITKTPWSVRKIPVYGEGVELLKEILQYSRHEVLFAKYTGELFTSDEVSDFLCRVSKTCGIKVYATLMRKSFAADLYRSKVNPSATRKLMGHKHENMSANWYATPADEEMIDAMKNRQYKQKDME